MSNSMDWKKINKESKMVIYAMDHAAVFGSLPGLERPDTLFRKLAPWTDAILTSYNSYRQWGNIINQKAGLLRCDGGWSPLQDTPFNNFNLYLDCDDAKALGAKGVICMAIFGDKQSEVTLANVAKLAQSAKKNGLFLVGEVLFSRPISIKERCQAIRITTEWGADIIKTEYPGNVDEFHEVLQSTYAPVVVLGGQKKNDPKDILDMISSVMKAGGNGVAIGRNVWQQENPEILAKAISSIVHKDMEPAAAFADAQPL